MEIVDMNIKKMCRALAIAVAICATVFIGDGSSALAADEGPKIITSGDYDYILHGLGQWSTVQLVKIRNYGEKLVIPKKIDGYNVSQVGTAGESVYDENGLLLPEKSCVIVADDTIVKELIIPDGVTLFTASFYTMRTLEKISYEDNPDLLNQLKIPKGIVLWDNNFYHCDNLEMVEIPKGSFINYGCFANTTINKMILHGSVSELQTIDDNRTGNNIYINTLKIVGNEKTVSLSQQNFDVNKVEVGKNIKSLYINKGLFDNICLKGDKTEVDIDNYISTVGKVTRDITSFKTKKLKKNICKYSWSKINVILTDPPVNGNELDINYNVSHKVKNGRYKTLKRIKNNYIKLKNSEKIKVQASYEVFKATTTDRESEDT